ncbi:MAG: hypothetical protein AB1758_20560 [Candidatus Eremiobacterota bacterium]
MKRRRSPVLASFLEHHRSEGTYLCFDCLEGRILDFDDHYALIRSFSEESEQPVDILVRLNQVSCIYPAEEKLREDAKLRKLGELFRQNPPPEPERREG